MSGPLALLLASSVSMLAQTNPLRPPSVVPVALSVRNHAVHDIPLCKTSEYYVHLLPAASGHYPQYLRPASPKDDLPRTLVFQVPNAKAQVR
jgi:hypothetical protein